MDEPYALLSTEDLSGATLPSPQASFSSAELRERDDLRVQGDKELIAHLLQVLKTTPGAPAPAAHTPVKVSELSLLGQWGDVFSKAFNQRDFVEWADRRGLDFNTMSVCNGVLQTSSHGQTTLQRFTLADDSRWWAVANPIIFIAQLLDPAELGLPYLGDRVSNSERSLPLDRVLAFHGYPMPANRLQVEVIVEELSTLGAFPGIDDTGLSRSLIHDELLNQQRDYRQLADALQALPDLDSFTLYKTRMQLKSGSLLARTLVDAAQLLKSTVEDTVVEVNGDYFFDHRKQLICSLPGSAQDVTQVREWLPQVPDVLWRRLLRLAEKSGTDIYPDHSVSLAGLLQAYGIERAVSNTEVAALITRLRQWPITQAPTLYAAARSLDERYIQNQYIGLRNDRHVIRKALYAVLRHGRLDGPNGLDRVIAVDPERLPVLLEPGRRKLQALVEQAEFVKIRQLEHIDPASHVLLSVVSGIGAHGLDGQWKMITGAVMADPKLAPQVRTLTVLAARMGGQLRTNKAVSLSQALRLYKVLVPTTLDEVRLAAQRWSISAPHRLYESDYWRALKPAHPAQPSGWILSEADRLRVLVVSQGFAPDPEQGLFSYLTAPVLGDKSPENIRAEADLLMIRLIATPRAQQLAGQLQRSIQWHGSDTSPAASRSALLWAALILSLDPTAGAHPYRIHHLDWSAVDFWGEPVAYVRRQLESSFRLAPGAAALAAHLMLCGQAPHLLVRAIPDSMPFLSTQAWILFEQYATYLERRVPGAARQLSHDEIMYQAYLPPRGGWATFLNGVHALPPIHMWAVVNGVITRQERYSSAESNLAIAALNELRARLTRALEAFASPILTQREIALQALQKVWPDNRQLTDLVLMWLPQDSVFAEDKRFENVHTGKKFSFVDLYMANRLEANSPHWHSSSPTIKYRDMAQQFHQLTPFGQVFAQRFAQDLQRLQSAYMEYLQNSLPQLSLPRREAIEFGRISFFALRKDAEPVGPFGLILCVSYYGDRHVYECFPKYLLLRPRRDLDYATLLQASGAPGQDVSTLNFHWSAYADGVEPADSDSGQRWPGFRISQLAPVLPDIDPLPQADAQGQRIPRSFDSPRSKALAAIVVEQHFFLRAAALREHSTVPLTLEQLGNDEDPWAEYLHRMAMAAL
ncbi:hypothetical protein ACSSUR_21915 [Pseudomonas cedrina]|uniref:hypothetical protein n=1 Tax=Pseudomonas cedrina TaxID=651740 RepID=UPI003ED9599F